MRRSSPTGSGWAWTASSRQSPEAPCWVTRIRPARALPPSRSTTYPAGRMMTHVGGSRVRNDVTGRTRPDGPVPYLDLASARRMNGTGGRPPARFLLAVIDAGSTVPPALSLATNLSSVAHQVRVLADPTIETSARSAGCSFSPWHEAPHSTPGASRRRCLRRWRLLTRTGRFVL